MGDEKGNMANMIGLFSSIGDHIPIFREDKLVEANPDGVCEQASLLGHLHVLVGGLSDGDLHRVGVRHRLCHRMHAW